MYKDLLSLSQKVAQTGESMEYIPQETITWLEQVGKWLADKCILLAIAALVLIVGWQIAKWITRIFTRRLKHSKVDSGVVTFLESVVGIGLKALVIGVAVNILGVGVSSILALLGSAGLAAGLSIQGTLKNFSGGVLLLVTKPFSVGDYIVDSNGNEGTVTSMDIIYTKLLTVDNRCIIIPNGTLADATIINATKEPQRRLEIKISVAYDTQIEEAKKVLYNIGMGHEKVIRDKEITVFLSTFDASGITVALRVWVNTDDYWTVKWEMQEQIKKKFEEAQIEIPYDKLDVHLVN